MNNLKKSLKMSKNIKLTNFNNIMNNLKKSLKMLIKISNNNRLRSSCWSMNHGPRHNGERISLISSDSVL